MNRKEDLKKELKKLFRSMNYLAKKYLLKKKIASKDVKVFYGIYQQLGLLWEFLGCQCKHWNGYKKKDNKLFCRICGKAKGIKESYYLLPVIGEKVIGRMIRLGKNKLEGLIKKQAEIVNDTIKFHGAKLNVSVFNGYVSKLDKIDKEINIAADRVVTLEDDGLAVEVSKYIASIKIKTPQKPAPVYGGFLWELPKKLLKKMPIILSYERQGRLREIELIR